MKAQEKLKTKVMEKKVKTVPTKEQLDKMVIDYLKASEKHLFKVKYSFDEEFPEVYYKVIPVEINDEYKKYSIQITFSKSDVKVFFQRVNWVSTKNALGMMKNEIFPQYKKHKSIKMSKDMREKFEQINSFINSPIADGGPRPGKNEIEAEIKTILRHED